MRRVESASGSARGLLAVCPSCHSWMRASMRVMSGIEVMSAVEQHDALHRPAPRSSMPVSNSTLPQPSWRMRLMMWRMRLMISRISMSPCFVCAWALPYGPALSACVPPTRALPNGSVEQDQLSVPPPALRRWNTGRRGSLRVGRRGSFPDGLRVSSVSVAFVGVSYRHRPHRRQD